MPQSDNQALTGTIIDQSSVLSVQDLSRICNVEERHIVEFVEEGVLNVIEVRSEWHFSGDALRRARLALRLERDFELNVPGVALALELLEELQALRRQVEARR